MRYLKRRLIEPQYYDARSTDERRLSSHRVKRCGTCTYEVPEADITVEDGAELCPMCVDTYTAEWKVNEESYVAEIKAESALRLVDPPQLSIRALTEGEPGVVTRITDSAGNYLSSTSPLRLVRTVATTVLMVGQRLTTSNTFTYSTGITDSVAPVYTAALITLTLVASGAVTTGPYGITMADGMTQTAHVFPNILAVR